jgi:hypothetical protein
MLQDHHSLNNDLVRCNNNSLITAYSMSKFSVSSFLKARLRPEKTPVNNPRHNWYRILSVSLGVLLAGVIGLIGFGNQHPAYTQQPTEYINAVNDAKVVEPWEVHPNLTAITPTAPNLVWQDATKKRLAVVTWTTQSSYNANYTAKPLPPTTREIWVTAVPDLKNFCKNFLATAPANTNLNLRLEKLMGLPASGGSTTVKPKEVFVQLWVSPNDLFRPSPDPEISDNVSSVTYPTTYTPEQKKWFDRGHKQWIDNLTKASYGPPAESGYPWTRLGYTYDWNTTNPKDLKTKVGLSEFVIAPGATIEVQGAVNTASYCTK